jgi:serine/threonine-protein kinase RsbW
MIRKIEFSRARLNDLESIHELIDEMCHQAQVDEGVCYAVRLAVEEAYVNIIDHGYAPDQPGPASVTLQSKPDQIIATIADRAPSFAPEDAPRPDLTLDLDERKIGGLGWHFIREMMDEIRYESDNAGNNRLTLVKHLHNAQQPAPQASRLEITISPRKLATVVAIGGSIDALSAKSLDQVINEQLAARRSKLVVDLARVSYVSSAGVYALLQALRDAHSRKGDLRIANASKEIRKVFDLSGFAKIAKIFPDVDAALASFEEG